MKLKIATWNISSGISNDYNDETFFDQGKSSEINETFLNEIIRIVKNEELDIICFQEIITTERINYINKIMKFTNLKYECHFELSECHLVDNTDCGISILSKFPIIEIEKLMFTNPKLSKTTKTGATYYTYDKGCLLAKIMIGDTYVNVITNHGFPFRRFDSKPQEHLNIFNELKQFISRYENVIATGDFNAENVTSFMPDIEHKVKSLFDEVTTTDGKKYDNILIDKKYNMIDKKIIKSMSDHYLCISTIEI